MSDSTGSWAREIATETSRDLQVQIPELARFLGPAGWRKAEERLAIVLREILQPCFDLEKRMGATLRSLAASRELLSRYPVAERLVQELASNWRGFLTAFLQDWVQDAPLLAERIGSMEFPERILSLGRETSDPHDGGKTVLILELARSRRVVYKPRSLGPERVFNQLLTEINVQKFPRPLQVAGVLDRGDHGWMEFIAPQECRSRSEVEDYYYRAGALLGLFHALSGVDGHSGNMIAARDQPVLVDLETLLHPLGEGKGDILRTGLLPVEGRQGYHLAAFGGKRPAPALRHGDAMARGFLKMADFLEDRIDLGGWIEQLAAQPRRRILRSTEVYLDFRRYLLSPQFLHAEKARRLALEAFAASIASTEEEKQSEMTALDRLDIPRIVSTGPAGVPSRAELRGELPTILRSICRP